LQYLTPNRGGSKILGKGGRRALITFVFEVTMMSFGVENKVSYAFSGSGQQPGNNGKKSPFLKSLW